MEISQQENAWQALRQLCFFEEGNSPEGLDQRDSPLSVLVELVLANKDAPLVSLRDVAEAIKSTFSIQATDEELSQVVAYLEDQGGIIRGGSDKTQLAITDTRRSDHLKKADEVRDLEKRVFENWKEQVRKRYPMISEARLGELEKDLRDLLTRLFTLHGIECASLLHVGSPEADKLHQSMESSLFQRLPQRDGLIGRIRDLEVTRFFKEASGIRLRFLGHLLRSSFVLHTIQIDPNSFHFLKGQLEGVTLYLDTNMLFALLGLNGETKKRVTQHLIDVSKSLGMTAKITQRSVSEFLYVIRDTQTTFGNLPPLDRQMALIPAELGEEGILKAYFERYARDGISFDLFVSEYRVAVSRLAEYGLEVGDEIEEGIPAHKDFQTISSRIYEASHAQYEQTYQRPLPSRVCDHDAFHVLLVREKRGRVPTNFNDSTAWFITWDGKLPRFTRIERDLLGDVPFCIFASVWLAFVTGLTLRTEDYEGTAAAMLWSSGLQTAIELPIEKLAKVAATLQAMKDKDPQTGVLMLLDARFTRAIRNNTVQEFESELPRLIDNSAISVLQDYEEETARSVAEAKAATDEVSQTHEKAEAMWISERKGVESRLKAARSENEELQRLVASKTFTLKAWIAAFIFAGLIVMWGSVFLFELSSRISVILASVVTVFGVLMLLSIWLGWSKAWKVATVAAVIATLAGSIASVILWLI